MGFSNGNRSTRRPILRGASVFFDWAPVAVSEVPRPGGGRPDVSATCLMRTSSEPLGADVAERHLGERL